MTPEFEEIEAALDRSGKILRVMWGVMCVVGALIVAAIVLMATGHKVAALVVWLVMVAVCVVVYVVATIQTRSLERLARHL